MALKGTLADLGIVDLVQIPFVGRRSGELVVTGHDSEAKLYYDRGSLVHAAVDDAVGCDALVRIVDWTDGDFEFKADVETPERSLDMDLHLAIMQALKIRDEMKREAEALGEEDPFHEDRGQIEILNGHLAAFVAANDFASHLCVVSTDGNVLAEAHGEDGPAEGLTALIPALETLLANHQRGRLNKIILQDDRGTVIAVHLENGSVLVAAAQQDAPLGVVSMKVGRLAAEVR